MSVFPTVDYEKATKQGIDVPAIQEASGTAQALDGDGEDTGPVPERGDDKRPQAIGGYLRDYGSEFSDRASSIVAIADDYGVDPYLLVAIFVLESSGGKHCLHNNCFGFGNYKYPDVLTGFVSVAQALSGQGRSGSYYAGKTTEEKIKTYNSVNEAYYPKVIKITETISLYED